MGLGQMRKFRKTLTKVVESGCKFLPERSKMVYEE